MELAAGIAGWAVSATLLLYVAVMLGRRLGETIADRLWIATALAVLQIAVVAQLLSPVHQLRPIPFLIVQAVLAIAVWATIKSPPPVDRRIVHDRVRLLLATPTRRVLLFAVALLLMLGLWLTLISPIHAFDDRAYRASRAAYWLQHRSLLPWSTHNERQVAFTAGSELQFFWPVMLTRWELAGRLAYFAGAPLCAAGLYFVLRQTRIARTVALAGVLVLVATPTFLRLQDGLYPEIWQGCFALGAAYFALRAAGDRAWMARHLAWVGLFVALAVNVKTTALTLLPAALVLPWLMPGAIRTRVQGTAGVIPGFAAGALLGGLLLTLGGNLLRDGHPMGAPAMLAVHQAESGARQLRTQAGRFLVGLIDLPVIPSESVRRTLSDAGNDLLRALDADQPLWGEAGDTRWPGPYRFGVGRQAGALSLGGMLWLPALVVAGALVLRGPWSYRVRLAILLLFVLPALLGPVFLIRWMIGMDRFLLPAYAMSLPIMMYFAQRLTQRRSGVSIAALALLVVTVVPASWEQIEAVGRRLRTPLTARMLDEPYHPALRHMPPGSRVLAVMEADTRDYGLFRARARFASEVISWGRSPFDPQRMRRLIDENDVTHVLVHNEHRVLMNWGADVETIEMVRWLTQQPDLREIVGVSPGMRLFSVRRAADPVPVSPLPRPRSWLEWWR